MKFMLALAAVSLALVCPVYAQTEAPVTASDIGPFLGKWAGTWEWTYLGDKQSRKADYVIEMDSNNKPVGTLHLGSAMLTGKSSRESLPEKTWKNHPKFTRRGEIILFSFPNTDGTKNYVFRLVNDRLEGSSTSASGDDKITLKKVKP